MANGPVIKIEDASDSSPLLANQSKKASWLSMLGLFFGAVFLLGLLGVNMQPSQRQQGGVSILTHLSSGASLPSNPDCMGWSPFSAASDAAQYTFCKNRKNVAANHAALSHALDNSRAWVFRATFKAPIAIEQNDEMSIAKFKYTPSTKSAKPQTLHLKYVPQNSEVALTSSKFQSFGGSNAPAMNQVFGATVKTDAYWTITLSNLPAVGADQAQSTQFGLEFGGDGKHVASTLNAPAQHQVLKGKDALKGKMSVESLGDSVVCAGVSMKAQPDSIVEYTACDESFHGEKKKSVKTVKKDTAKAKPKAKPKQEKSDK